MAEVFVGGFDRVAFFVQSRKPAGKCPTVYAAFSGLVGATIRFRGHGRLSAVGQGDGSKPSHFFGFVRFFRGPNLHPENQATYSLMTGYKSITLAGNA